jgi:hypothetical protein
MLVSVWDCSLAGCAGLLAAVRRKLGPFQSRKSQGWKDNLAASGHFVVISHVAQHGHGSADVVFWPDGKTARLVGYHISSVAVRATGRLALGEIHARWFRCLHSPLFPANAGSRGGGVDVALVERGLRRSHAPAVRSFAERQMKAVGGASAFVAPGLLESADQGALQILRDLSDVMTERAGHLFDHHRPVRFAAERQQDLTYALGQALAGPDRLFAGASSGGDFQMLRHRQPILHALV